MTREQLVIEQEKLTRAHKLVSSIDKLDKVIQKYREVYNKDLYKEGTIRFSLPPEVWKDGPFLELSNTKNPIIYKEISRILLEKIIGSYWDMKENLEKQLSEI